MGPMFVGGSYAVHPAASLAAPAGTLPGDILLALLNEDSANAAPASWTKAGKDTAFGLRHVAMMKIATGVDALAFGTTPENGSMVAYRGLALPTLKSGDWAEINVPYPPGTMNLPAIAADDEFVIVGFALANGFAPTLSPGAGYTQDYEVNVNGDDWAFLWQHSTAAEPGVVVPDASYALAGAGSHNMWGQAFVVPVAAAGLTMFM